jgi:hypothetical protein
MVSGRRDNPEHQGHGAKGGRSYAARGPERRDRRVYIRFIQSDAARARCAVAREVHNCRWPLLPAASTHRRHQRRSRHMRRPRSKSALITSASRGRRAIFRLPECTQSGGWPVSPVGPRPALKPATTAQRAGRWGWGFLIKRRP